jgi:hypothetical protein
LSSSNMVFSISYLTGDKLMATIHLSGIYTYKLINVSQRFIELR